MSIRKIQSRCIQYKIILIGDCQVGKTSIFQSFFQTIKPKNNYSSVDFRKKYMQLHDKQIILSLWDTPGHQMFRSIIANYIKDSHGVIIVFDMNQIISWNNAKQIWYNLVRKNKRKIPCLLLGNKSDLQSTISRKDIENWCKIQQICFIQTSAKTGYNIQQSFKTFCSLVDIYNDPSWRLQINDNLSQNLEIKSCSDTECSTIKQSMRAYYNGDRPNDINKTNRMKKHQYSK